METKPIWDLLSSITIGTVVAWIAVICTTIGTLCAGTIKLYKIFIKYKEMEDNNENQKNMIQAHENILKEIQNSLNDIKDSLEEQKDVNLKQIRHTIVHSCEEALCNGEISINKLQSLEEMYQEYVEVFHGNGYVKTLIIKVRKLKIIGKIDD